MTTSPLTIRMHAADNVAIVANDGGLPAGSMLPDGLTLVDRDFVERSNLQRQSLYTEEDAASRLPKAVAAERRLRAINSEIEIVPLTADVTARTISRLAGRPDVLVDGSDNFETRFLLNDYCVREGIPWVYGGAVGAEARAMALRPGLSACLRCAMEELPPPGSVPTCDHAGVLGGTTGAVGALQSAAALRLLAGDRGWEGRMTSLNVWTGEARSALLARRADCPACGRGLFPFLDGRALPRAVAFCGRNLVQITPPEEARLDLPALAARLRPAGGADYNGFLLTLRDEGLELNLFPDGRALIKGTQDEARARAFYARVMG